MLYNFPNEILDLIFDKVIHPSNNYFFIIKSISKYINNCNIIEKIKNKKLICYYCLNIFNKEYVIYNGGYCSTSNKPICKQHYYICRICNLKHDFYQHSFLCDCCLNCKIS